MIWQGAVSWDPVAFSGDTVLVPCPGFRGGWVCWGGRRQEGRATRCAGFRGSWSYHRLTGCPRASRLTAPDLRHVASKTVPAALAQLTSRGLGEGPLRKSCEGPCQLNTACKWKGCQLLGGRTEQRPEEALRLETPSPHTDKALPTLGAGTNWAEGAA